MKKERRSKILIVISLALTLMALTVGFAAFSQTLNISSNATVTPNETDFKIMIYGFKSADAALNFEENGIFNEDDLSTSVSYPSNTGNYVSATNASIDNSNHTIGNISVQMTEPNTGSVYFFIIKNEGKYDSYLDLSKYEYDEGEYIMVNKGTCIKGEGTTQELLDAACPYLANVLVITNSEGNQLPGEDNIVKIPKEDYIVMGYGVGYMETSNRVDGPFSVEFPEEQLIFSTAK